MDPEKYGIFAEETDLPPPQLAPGSTRRDWVLREIALLGHDELSTAPGLELPMPER